MEKHYPLVSIIIPLYNAGRYLEAALESIVRQTYSNWELIVVNDGATDQPERVLDLFPVHQYICQPNQGPSSARNRGLEVARGEFIAFLDADDRWPYQKLETQLRSFELDTTLQAVTGLVEFVFSETDPQARRYQFRYEQNRAIHAHLGAGLFRRSAFEQVGYFNESLRFSEDIDWFNRAKEGNLRLKVLEEVGLYLTIHQNSLTYGATIADNGTFQALKLALDRRRSQQIQQVPQLSDYIDKKSELNQ
ncbi:glycosyltransferase family A protein [Telluribacter sp.]|uniref:glycosyltransferase family 2 protein n=1 Tax=Telluribacter sp. TaxID=1978767 RepID=UPI002E108842|nr:glycosyltransferase family A protein [Telluribacter sp.]